MWVDKKWDAVIWEFEGKKKKENTDDLFCTVYYTIWGIKKQHLCNFPLSLLTKRENFK